MRELPKLNWKYWTALVAASIFGTNTGDFLSDYLHLGHIVGLPYLGVALAGLFLVETISPWGSVVFFWTAIIVIRTAATNIADATHDIGIYGVGAVATLFAGFVLAVRRYKSQSDAYPSDPRTPRVDAFYWVVMALAGIVGTLAGDLSSAALGFACYGVSSLAGAATGSFSFAWMIPGHVIATLIFGSGILAMLLRYSIADLARPYPYWIMIALIRSAGTALGDYISKTPLQLYGATIVDGTLFAIIIALFYVFEKDNSSRQLMSMTSA